MACVLLCRMNVCVHADLTFRRLALIGLKLPFAIYRKSIAIFIIQNCIESQTSLPLGLIEIDVWLVLLFLRFFFFQFLCRLLFGHPLFIDGSKRRSLNRFAFTFERL